jgi:hypothetical protein
METGEKLQNAHPAFPWADPPKKDCNFLEHPTANGMVHPTVKYKCRAAESRHSARFPLRSPIARSSRAGQAEDRDAYAEGPAEPVTWFSGRFRQPFVHFVLVAGRPSTKLL